MSGQPLRSRRPLLALVVITLMMAVETPTRADSGVSESPLEEIVEEAAPVSAEEQPLVTPEDPDTLRENAVGEAEGEDAASEIVVTPLSDRCAASDLAATQTDSSDSSPSDTPLYREGVGGSEEAIEEAVTEETIETIEEATEAAISPDEEEAEVIQASEPSDSNPSESSDDLGPESEEVDPETAAKIAQAQRDLCLLYQADQLHQEGQLSEAQALYETVKPPFDAEVAPVEPLVAVTDPQALSPAGQVYLREAQAGLEKNLTTRILVPLELLTQQYPEFVPGHIQYAEALNNAAQPEQALDVLNHAVTLHPDNADVVRANIQLASEQERWMDASMQARRFAQIYPDHPESEAFVTLAQDNLKHFQGEIRDRLTANTIANVITGAVTFGVTGNIWNTLSTLQTTTLMLRGEEGVGRGISKSIKRQVPMVEDEEVVTYVQDLGQKLAAVAGRDEFEYEFFVVMDENLNAFALPGGKVFVNAGAIAKTRSESELAGLLAHEISHAVLSHGFQLVSNGSLLSDISRFVPYAGYATNLVVLNYSRNMEREADELGTRILSAAGYPADGLHNLMQTLGAESQSRPLFAWMSTHPETEERVHNIQRQIQSEGFDRYGFEGVEQHDYMREKVKVMIEEAKKKAEEEEKNRPWWR